MVRHGFDLEDFHKVVELADGAISPNGQYVAFVSTHWDVEADEFVKRIHVSSVHPDGTLLESLWSVPQAGIRTLRFSPDSQFLAFFRTSSSTDNADDELVVYSIATGQTKVVFGGKELAYLVWSPASDALFCCCETSSHLTANGVYYVDAIPKRLPWWHKKMQVYRIAFTCMDMAREFNEPVSPEMIEIGHLCISPDGETLAFIEERCENGTKVTLYLHRIDQRSLRQLPEIMLPNSFITTPIFSPSGQYLAYVGARVKDLELAPQPLHSFRDSTLSQSGYGINAYDARVHIIDMSALTIAQLVTDAPLCAGIPTGLSPLHQEIFWSNDRHLIYIATRGNQTALVEQDIDDDDSLQCVFPGNGSSRGHSFASDGTCFFFQSEQGRPFVPAMMAGVKGDMQLFPDALDHYIDDELVWQTPEPVHVGSLSGAWLYLPAQAEQSSLPDASIPLIVSIYGGASPLCMAFDDVHQALTSRGYAVLVVNPSGCGGFGPLIADRHVNDWGKRVVAEVIDTLHTLFQRYPALDANSVGIYGGSYGGFLVLLLLAQSRMFKAACSMAGISNITSYWGGSRFGHFYGLTALSDAFPWSRPDIFVQQSPIFRAHQIATPLLLLHGECDPIVPLSESEQIFVALKTLEQRALLVVFPDEDHGIRSCPSARLTSRRYLIAWFDSEIRGLTEEWQRLII